MVALLLAIALLAPHPIHTTVLQLRWNAKGATLEGTLRIFQDDLSAAARAARVSPAVYVLKKVSVASRDQPVALEICGEQRVADAVIMCLRARVQELGIVRVRNELLLERYEDQVNIVRVDRGGTSTVLLTRATRERVVD